MAAAPIVRNDRVLLGERAVAFTLLRVPRRRNVHVMVNDDGMLEVRAPWRFSLDEARAAICEHQSWVLGALEQSQTRIRMRACLVSGTVLPFLDERFRLRVCVDAQLSLFEDEFEQAGRPGHVLRRGRELVVRVHSLEQSAIRRLLEGWYRAQAEDVLRARIEPLAEALGVDFARVSIRAQRSRWGSCSTAGTISLNWRLLLLSSALCDYVLAHELCHLQEMNHSPAFWRLVGRLVPDYRERRRQLDAVGYNLAL